MNEEGWNVLMAIGILLFVALPGIVAETRRHKYVYVICFLSVVGAITVLESLQYGLIIWAVAFTWSIWPKKT